MSLINKRPFESFKNLNVLKTDGKHAALCSAFSVRLTVSLGSASASARTRTVNFQLLLFSLFPLATLDGIITEENCTVATDKMLLVVVRRRVNSTQTVRISAADFSSGSASIYKRSNASFGEGCEPI